MKSIFVLTGLCLVVIYASMWSDNLMISYYGKKLGSYGRACHFVDWSFTSHEIRYMNQEKDWGIHGCPLYIYPR